MLGSESAVEDDGLEGEDEPAATPTTPSPEFGSRRRWLTSEPEDEAPAPEAKPAKKAGGTLFERMASASRGGNKAASDDDDKDPLDIPRFLRSQNNQ